MYKEIDLTRVKVRFLDILSGHKHYNSLILEVIFSGKNATINIKMVLKRLI